MPVESWQRVFYLPNHQNNFINGEWIKELRIKDLKKETNENHGSKNKEAWVWGSCDNLLASDQALMLKKFVFSLG